MGTFLTKEVNWHLRNMEEKDRNGASKYGHPKHTMFSRRVPTYFEVDIEKGIYQFDCCGFVKYMLVACGIKQDKLNFLEPGRGPNTCGIPQDWVNFAKQLEKVPTTGWRRVFDTPTAGDILCTKTHVMISMGTVNKEDGRLMIADSTKNHHGKTAFKGTDTREDKPGPKTGMGKGFIRVKKPDDKKKFKCAWYPIGSKSDLWDKMWVVRPIPSELGDVGSGFSERLRGGL